MFPLVLALLVVFSDQLTKHVIRARFAYGDSVPVIDGFFNLVYVRNTGAAWGMFGGQNTALTVVSIAMLVFLVMSRKSLLTDAWDHRLAFGLLVGGILGNLIDRIKTGWVTDFLDFHIGDRHWPSFNIADSAICIGVGIYIVSTVWLSRHPLHQPVAGEEDAGEELKTRVE